MKRNYYIALIMTLGMLAGYLYYICFYTSDNYSKVSTSSLATSTNIQANAVAPNTIKILFSTSTAYFSFKYAVPQENQPIAILMASSAQAWLKDTSIDKVHTAKEAEDMGIFLGAGQSCYEYSSDYTKYTSQQYISYVSQVYSYTCGAHGSTYNESYILDGKSGFVKKLSDIYTDSVYGYLSDYSRKVLPSILAKEDIKISDIQDMFNEGTSPNKDNWSSFYFKGDNLVIIFGQYQIGPYVIGIHELEIPTNNLLIYKK